MKKCSIISFIEKDAAKLLAALDKSSYILCADGGYAYAKECNITPDIIIGDFDSYKGTLPDDIPAITVPSEKDDTDTGLCISYAIEHGFDDITIYGGLGGRLDHTIANLQLISSVAEKGIRIRILDISNQAYSISGCSIEIPRRSGSYISVFSASDISEGVSEAGVKYCLDNATLHRNFPLGVSNEFADDKALISVKKGTLIIIVSHQLPQPTANALEVGACNCPVV